jgi:hypothetical protein
MTTKQRAPGAHARPARRHTIHALLAGPMLAGVLAAVCPNPNPIAVIHYRQLGACINAQTGNGPVAAPPSHAVVIFRVSTIDNTKTGVDWSFNSSALTVNSVEIQQNLGGTGPVPIPNHQNVAVNALVGILVATDNANGSDASTTNYFLLYPNVPPAPGTLAAKENSKQVSYPFAQDCSVIAGG